jgi:hypothetical protein
MRYHLTMSENSTEFKLSDSVLHRVVQIVQEGILLGIDVADLLRQIKLTTGIDESTLVLTKEYVEFVELSHTKYLDELSEKDLK